MEAEGCLTYCLAGFALGFISRQEELTTLITQHLSNSSTNNKLDLTKLINRLLHLKCKVVAWINLQANVFLHTVTGTLVSLIV